MRTFTKIAALLIGMSLGIGCENTGVNRVTVEANTMNTWPPVILDLSNLSPDDYRHESNKKYSLSTYNQLDHVTVNRPVKVVLIPIDHPDVSEHTAAPNP
ncbi:MAG: hypothetical protein AAGJ38_09180 [Planctomycetota bacterium]